VEEGGEGRRGEERGGELIHVPIFIAIIIESQYETERRHLPYR
jgi:hypothetical protein